MVARLLLVSRYSVKPESILPLIDRLSRTGNRRRCYRAVDDTEVLELRALSDTASLSQLIELLEPEIEDYASLLAGDIRREVLYFVEAPKPIDDGEALPTTPYIQMRHVEVKPDRKQQYHQWRSETIFDVVRSHSEIEAFLAYHSVISGAPGVMFISGFSCDPSDYNAVFSSERYGNIVKEAGDQYITGGLYTKTYRSAAEAHC